MPRTCFNGDGGSSYLSVAGLKCYDLPGIFFVPLFAVHAVQPSRLNLHIDLEKFSEVLAEAARFVGDSANVAKKKRECICYQVF